MTDVPHNCEQVLAETHGTREDLSDQPLTDAEVTWFTDGSSYVLDGVRRAGAAVVSQEKTIWSSALSPGTSAQQAELVALTKALEMAKGKTANIYTDSRYAFTTAHVHGEIYRQRGLLTSARKKIKNKTEIISLLKALFLPRKISIIHCPGHQKGGDPIAEGNRQADEAARQAALKTEILILTEENNSSFREETTKAARLYGRLNYSKIDEDLIGEILAQWDPDTQTWRYGDKVILPY